MLSYKNSIFTCIFKTINGSMQIFFFPVTNLLNIHLKMIFYYSKMKTICLTLNFQARLTRDLIKRNKKYVIYFNRLKNEKMLKGQISYDDNPTEQSD